MPNALCRGLQLGITKAAHWAASAVTSLFGPATAPQVMTEYEWVHRFADLVGPHFFEVVYEACESKCPPEELKDWLESRMRQKDLSARLIRVTKSGSEVDPRSAVPALDPNDGETGSYAPIPSPVASATGRRSASQGAQKRGKV